MDRLRDGPLHTLDLARDVLALSGHDGAAAAAVHALLGPDPRFRVDDGDLWSLAPEAAGSTRHLDDVRWAVVDLETTGGSFETGHRIVELAVVEVRRGLVVDEFVSLVNPGCRVPSGVGALTGITDPMVSVAPWFEDIAEEVRSRLAGRVFVAHNVAFDWGFLSRALGAAMVDVPPVRRVCTVHMARRLLPRVRHRNLDVLAAHFGLRNHARHRAYGDALVTARILVRLLEEAWVRGIRDLGGLEAHLRGPGGRRRVGPGGRSARKGRPRGPVDG